MKKYFWPIILFIVIFAGYLRLINLDTVPPHLGNDEISIAYDSYSVRLIGKDEHGYSWPLSFKSHRSYKAPLYAYLNIPFNYVLGNTEYGIRTLSAIAGSVSVVLTGVIGNIIAGPVVGLIAALLMAIDPKNIFASRIGYEANLATAVLLVGVWGLLNFVRLKKNGWLILGSFFMGLSIWSYHTQWGLVPMLMVAMPLLFRKEINIKRWWLGWLIVVMVAAPILYNFVTVQRADANNRASSQIWLGDGQFKDYLAKSSDSQLKKWAKTLVIPNYYYAEHFDLAVNFSSGSDFFNGRSPINNGWFLLAGLPLIIIGLTKGEELLGKWWTFVLVWWLLCPIIPATTGTVSAVRNLVFIVPTSLLTAAGTAYLIKTKSKWLWLIVALMIFNFAVFSRTYYIHFPKDSGNNFQYGYKQAWEFIKPNIAKYDKVVVEDRFGLTGQFTGVPHLYFGYFGAFTVNEMQKRYNTDGLNIGKYIFKYVDWNKENYQPKTIYIVSAINPKAGAIADKLKQLEIIKNTDNENQFIIYETTE